MYFLEVTFGKIASMSNTRGSQGLSGFSLRGCQLISCSLIKNFAFSIAIVSVYTPLCSALLCFLWTFLRSLLFENLREAVRLTRNFYIPRYISALLC